MGSLRKPGQFPVKLSLQDIAGSLCIPDACCGLVHWLVHQQLSQLACWLPGCACLLGDGCKWVPGAEIQMLDGR
jgi:hypothetical protein